MSDHLHVADPLQADTPVTIVGEIRRLDLDDLAVAHGHVQPAVMPAAVEVARRARVPLLPCRSGGHRRRERQSAQERAPLVGRQRIDGGGGLRVERARRIERLHGAAAAILQPAQRAGRFVIGGLTGGGAVLRDGRNPPRHAIDQRGAAQQSLDFRQQVGRRALDYDHAISAQPQCNVAVFPRIRWKEHQHRRSPGETLDGVQLVAGMGFEERERIGHN